MPSSFIHALLIAIGSSIDNFAVGLSLGLTGLPCKIIVNASIALANAIGAFIASFAGDLIINNASSSSSSSSSYYYYSPLGGQSTASLLAALVFAHLSKEELSSYKRGEPTSPLAKLATENENESKGGSSTTTTMMIKLAIPMTLNNLAGGVAGGVSGVTPTEAGICALIVSFVFMMGGHVLGGRIRLMSSSSSSSIGCLEKQQKKKRNGSAGEKNRGEGIGGGDGGGGGSGDDLYFDPRVGAAFIFGGLALMQLFEVVNGSDS